MADTFDEITIHVTMFLFATNINKSQDKPSCYYGLHCAALISVHVNESEW